MEHDDPDRRDRPQQDADGASSDPSEAAASDEPTEPIEPAQPPEPIEPYSSVEPIEPTEPITDARAEIEAWPSQDATVADETAEQRLPDAGSDRSGEPSSESAWPTEPPAAGSASEDDWLTAPPERGAEPILERPAEEPVPSEVEAYPAAAAAADAAPIPEVAAAHSVPAAESATGESTQCPRCGTENRPGLAFCRNCGQRLVAAGVAGTVERPGVPEGTQACARCGTHNRAGVAFCQNCGANLRGTAPGYVPPAVAEEGAVAVETERGGAILGPVVLLIGMIGIITAYLLPFKYGAGSLFDRAYGAGGYGVAFWNGYPDVNATLADQAYFGLAAPTPLFALLLLALAIAGFVRAVPGTLQRIGLGIALLWSVGLIVLFVVVELAGSWSGDIVALLRDLSPAGIIFFLAALIVLIGSLTRFGRS
jgi:hypothetical protein